MIINPDSLSIERNEKTAFFAELKQYILDAVGIQSERKDMSNGTDNNNRSYEEALENRG